MTATEPDIVIRPANEVPWEDLQAVFGTVSVFADAGFIEVARPTPRRTVMRLALTDRSPSRAPSGVPPLEDDGPALLGHAGTRTMPLRR